MFLYDWTLLLLLPALLLSLYAQWKVKSTFKKHQDSPIRGGLTGAEVARQLAQANRLQVEIEPHSGYLSDHYSPSAKTLNLSEPVYQGRNLSAAGVAAHELGHAIQDREGYLPLVLRSGLVPLASFGSNLSWILFLAGLFLAQQPLLYAGIILFSFAVLFTLITLPVEFDASKRALAALRDERMVNSEQLAGVKEVLNAAALTYVAAAAMALLNLLRMVVIARARD